MRRSFYTLGMIVIVLLSHAQTPNLFNYQAVVRAADGKILMTSNVSFRFTILKTNTSGTPVYSETHTTSTNEFGLVSLSIGSGSVLSGNFSTIDWGSDAHFLKVDLDVNGGTTFTDMSTQQLVAVPYALHATTVTNSDNDSSNEIQVLTKTANDLSLSKGGGTVDISDDDADPANEIQNISKTGTDLTLSDGGGTVSIADNDNDATNEHQSISTTGTDLILSDGGGTVSIADNDNDSTNEVQSISKAGTDLILSDGGGTVSIADNDNDSTNEVQSISKTGTNLTLSDGGGTVSIADNDNDASNEYQSIGKSGTNITLSDGGGTVSIADNDNDSTNELQSISKSGINLTLSNGGGTVNVADNDNNSQNEIQSLSATNDTLFLSGSNDTLPFDSFNYWSRNGDYLFSDSGKVVIGPYGVSAYKLAVNSTTETYGGIYSLNNIGQYASSTVNSNYFNTTQESSNPGSLTNLQLSTTFYPETGTGSTKGVSNVVNSAPDAASGQRTYGLYQDINRSDSGSGLTYGTYLDLDHFGTDGGIYGHFTDVRSSSKDDDVYGNYMKLETVQPHSDLMYGSYTDMIKRGTGGTGGSMFGSYHKLRRNSSIYSNQPSVNSGSMYGTFSYLINSPLSGNYQTIGNGVTIYSSPDAASGAQTRGFDAYIARSDSGSGSTMGVRLNLSHGGNDGEIYGVYTSISASKANPDALYGESKYLINRATGLTGTMYGSHTTLRRRSNTALNQPDLSSGSVVGDFLHMSINPQTGNYKSYGLKQEIHTYPDNASSSPFYGIFQDINRGDSGSGSTYGYYLDLDHTGNDGVVYGTFVDIDVAGTNNNPDAPTGGYFNVYAPGSTGVYGVRSLVRSSGTNTAASSTYGVYVDARRDGANNGTPFGARFYVRSHQTGTGTRSVFGTYTNTYNVNATGTRNLYGHYVRPPIGNYSTFYAGYFEGNVYTTGSYLPSDEILKLGVTKSGSSLQRILDLNVYNYAYDTSKYIHMNLPKGTQTGFTAQNLALLFPELTTKAHQPALLEDEIASYKELNVEVTDAAKVGMDFTAVNYVGLIPHLTKAIQEQQTIIDTQSAVIGRQEDQIKEQGEMLEAISQRMAELEVLLKDKR